jgi:hypothetical protein
MEIGPWCFNRIPAQVMPLRMFIATFIEVGTKFLWQAFSIE